MIIAAQIHAGRYCGQQYRTRYNAYTIVVLFLLNSRAKMTAGQGYNNRGGSLYLIPHLLLHYFFRCLREQICYVTGDIHYDKILSGAGCGLRSGQFTNTFQKYRRQIYVERFQSNGRTGQG